MPEVQKQAPDGIRPYKFHGLDLSWKNGDKEALGDCPWCGKERHFSVNLKTGQWRCYVCGEGTDKGGGNAIVFLRKLWESSDQATEDYEDLRSERRLLYPETLVHWQVCRSALNGRWLVPGYNAEGSLIQLYSWGELRGKFKLFPTPTLGHGIHGVASDGRRTVYLCEGPWDAIALWEILGRCKWSSGGGEGKLTQTANPDASLLADACVLAVPGCSTFHASWLPMFAGRQRVVLMYDSDHPGKHPATGKEVPPAGYSAMRRVARLLSEAKSPPEKIQYLCWGEQGYDPSLEHGYDVRDWLSEKEDLVGRITRLQSLLSKVQDAPDDWLGIVKGRSSDRAVSRTDGLSPVECRSYADVTLAWRKALRWRKEMEDVLGVMLAVALSTSQVGDQLFLQVIGDAGCLHRDTLIFDPIDGTTRMVERRWKEGRSFYVWSILSDGRLGTIEARPPMKFPSEPIYKVMFASGRSIKVTAGHRFRVDGGKYLSVRQVQDVLRASDACRLPSISEHDLSTLLPGGLHLKRTAQGSLRNCFACSRLYGERPLSGAGIYQEILPSLAYALEHIRLSSRKDGPATIGRHSHPGQSPGHRSTQGFCVPVSSQMTALELPRVCEGILGPCLFCSQPAVHTQQQRFLSCRDRGFASVFAGSVSWGESRLDRLPVSPGIRKPRSHGRSEIQPSQNVLLDKDSLLRQSYFADKVSALESPVQVVGDHLSIISDSDYIISIEPIGEDEYFDFHVPGTENYWAEGVFHHNSGKTRFCDAMLVSERCFALEHLTGFHSGWKDESGEDYSLLSRINHKTLITPEGDVMMSSPHFIEIMSQQRRIFDGTSGATYKNRKKDLRYTGLRTPWIIAGTPTLMNMDQSRLGDRFLRVCINPPTDDERREILRRVAFTAMRSVVLTSDGDAVSHIDERMRAAYQLTGGYVDYLVLRAEALLSRLVVNEEPVADFCSLLGEFTADMRARPDPDHKKEVSDHKEMPTRLTHQYVRLAYCLAVVLGKREIDSEVLRVVRKVAIDTGRGRTLQMVHHLYDHPDGLDPRALALYAALADEKVRILLRFLRAIKVAEVYTPVDEKGRAMKLKWRLTSRMRKLYRQVMEELDA